MAPGRGESRFSAGVVLRWDAACVEAAVMADFDESGGKDALQKPTQELFAAEGEAFAFGRGLPSALGCESAGGNDEMDVGVKVVYPFRPLRFTAN